MNQNSFAENVNMLTDATKKAMDALNILSNTVTAETDTVPLIIDDETIYIPSYKNVLNRLETVENTVGTFTSGNGTVKLIDGTNRKIKVSTMPSTPSKIENLNNITKFSIDSNWFFEDLMFPKMIVKVDLTDKVDDNSDRIKAKRVIIDYGKNKEYIRSFYSTNIENKKISYPELIQLLDGDSNITYFEDDEILDFPLVENGYIGNFTITDKRIIDNSLWYYFDSLYYSVNNVYDKNNLNNIILTVGDKLVYNQSIFTIDEINNAEKRVKLSSDIGLDIIEVNTIISYYNDPFRLKEISIPVGIHEINCLFFKGVNEEYNLLCDSWSDAISFITNTLTFDDPTNSDMTFESYYNTYVADFGQDWIAQAKERKVAAYNGKIPNTVILNADDFKVVQINTQLNDVSEDTDIKNTQAKIISLKSNIKTLRDTISLQRGALTQQLIEDDVINEDDNSRTVPVNKKYSKTSDLSSKIQLNTNKLKSVISEYTSNVEYLDSLLKTKNYQNVTPKYRIRGFFPIPEAQYSNVYEGKNGIIYKEGKQDIIAFEIRYRYLKLDESGTNLTTFSYTDTNNNSSYTGVFSDWNVISSVYKEKVYNERLGIYEWKVENSADGSEININQIDIPITSGEKVEICVRSISEAGYPGNPLKSDWSNSIIISFPDNLSPSNNVENIINDVKSEMTAIELNSTLQSEGFYTHKADETITSDKIYHHDSQNILCKLNLFGKDCMTIYDAINVLADKIKELGVK